jgi:hypothetical protein
MNNRQAKILAEILTWENADRIHLKRVVTCALLCILWVAVSLLSYWLWYPMYIVVSGCWFLFSVLAYAQINHDTLCYEYWGCDIGSGTIHVNRVYLDESKYSILMKWWTYRLFFRNESARERNLIRQASVNRERIDHIRKLLNGEK